MPFDPIPILMYHAIETAPRPPKYKHFYVLAKEFVGQMQMLRRRGYTPISFEMLASARANRTAVLPSKPVLLTFDDGYENLFTNVHPLLCALKFPYTVFLISEKVGQTNDWVSAEGYEPTSLLSWPQIREMQTDPHVHFEAHTATHPRLADLPAAQAREELMSSKEELEQQLQRPMTTLCYPYGSYNDTVTEIARDLGYAQAATTDFGRVRFADNPLHLPRISVYHVPPVSLTYGIGPLNFLWRLESRKDSRP